MTQMINAGFFYLLMKRLNDKKIHLLGVGLVIIFALVACKPSTKLEESVSQLRAQVAELQAQTDAFRINFSRNQVSKNSRLADIEDQLDDLEEKLK